MPSSMLARRHDERWAVVYEPDEAIRACLRDILSDLGYGVLTPVRPVTLLAILACRQQPVWVLLSNAHADHADVAAILARVVATPLLQRHRYVLLSTLERQLSAPFRAHLAQLGVPVLPKPFDLADLEAALAVGIEARELVTA